MSKRQNNAYPNNGAITLTKAQIAFYPAVSDINATVLIDNTIIKNGSASAQLPIVYGNNRFWMPDELLISSLSYRL